MPTTYLASATPLNRFLGRCDHCDRPIGVENDTHFADKLRVACPDCTTSTMLERLYGTVDRMRCDGRCESAIGPVCVCACGGMNHGNRYFRTGEALATAIAAYRQTTQRRRAAAQRRAETRRATRERAELETRDAYARDNAVLLNSLQNYAGTNGFLVSLAGQVRNGRTLTQPQIDAGNRVLAQDAAYQARVAAERAQEQAEGTPVPEGRHFIEGVVYKVYEPDQDAEFPTWKMAIKVDGGFKIKVSVPSNLSDELQLYRVGYESIIGKRVALTATLKRWDRNPMFGFGKRPTGARIIPELIGSSLD